MASRKLKWRTQRKRETRRSEVGAGGKAEAGERGRENETGESEGGRGQPRARSERDLEAGGNYDQASAATGHRLRRFHARAALSDGRRRAAGAAAPPPLLGGGRPATQSRAFARRRPSFDVVPSLHALDGAEGRLDRPPRYRRLRPLATRARAPTKAPTFLAAASPALRARSVATRTRWPGVG